MRILVLTAMIFAALAGASDRAAADDTVDAEMFERFNAEFQALQLKAMNDDYLQSDAEASAALFDRYFADIDFAAVSRDMPPDQRTWLLYRLFDASNSVGDARYRPLVEAVFDNFDTAAINDTQTTAHAALHTMQKFYTSFRLFDAEAALRARFPDSDLAAPPPIRVGETAGAAGRQVLAMSMEDGALLRQGIDLSKGPRLVVVSHPGCGFSKNAWEAIVEDADIVQAIGEVGIVLASASTALDDRLFTEWNFAGGEVPVFVADDERDWPEINYWGTPTFYFYLDGALKRKMVGWRREESPARLALMRVGFSEIGIEVGGAPISRP